MATAMETKLRRCVMCQRTEDIDGPIDSLERVIAHYKVYHPTRLETALADEL